MSEGEQRIPELMLEARVKELTEQLRLMTEARDYEKEAHARTRAYYESRTPSSARVTTDAAGFPKAPPTIIEQLAVEALNEVKAWRDSDGNEGFPHTTREKIEAILMTYEQRRDPLTLDLRDLSTLRLRCGYIINGYGDAKLEAQEMLRLIETAMKAPRSATSHTITATQIHEVYQEEFYRKGRDGKSLKHSTHAELIKAVIHRLLGVEITEPWRGDQT